MYTFFMKKRHISYLARVKCNYETNELGMQQFFSFQRGNEIF